MCRAIVLRSKGTAHLLTVRMGARSCGPGRRRESLARVATRDMRSFHSNSHDIHHLPKQQ